MKKELYIKEPFFLLVVRRNILYLFKKSNLSHLSHKIFSISHKIFNILSNTYNNTILQISLYNNIVRFTLKINRFLRRGLK